MSDILPLGNWRSRAPHHADDCRLQQCAFCGCCVHGKRLAVGCKVELAPTGMSCPNSYCGREGKA